MPLIQLFHFQTVKEMITQKYEEQCERVKMEVEKTVAGSLTADKSASEHGGLPGSYLSLHYGQYAVVYICVGCATLSTKK